MSAGTLAHAVELRTIASPTLWAVTVAALLLLLLVDLLITRRPHEESMRASVGWSVFYLLLPVLFGFYLWAGHGGGAAVEFFTGFVVEKSLSVDNLFVFMLLLAAFAVPPALARQVLLYGIVGALVLRVVFIWLGAAALQSGTWAFLLFGGILIVTAGKIIKGVLSGGEQEVDISSMRTVRLVRRFVPVTEDYRGSRLVVRDRGRSRSPRWRWPPSPSWPRTSSSPWTRCPPCTGSRRIRSSSSPPTPSRCWGCGRCTSSSRAC
ncbi:hypothetical protein ACFQ0B_68270 [Nonomuraea thailandensis]